MESQFLSPVGVPPHLRSEGIYRVHTSVYKLFLLYRNYHQFPNNDEDFELLQLRYHAYVAYNENSAEDDAWVMDELQPNMEDGPEKLQLCIKSRDFTPGHFLLDSIDKRIHQSRKTILVLSPNFVVSGVTMKCKWLK